MNNHTRSSNALAELEAYLKRRFPRWHKPESEIKSEAERVHLHIDDSKMPIVAVTYYQGQRQWTIALEYKRQNDSKNGEYYWYCTTDVDY